MLPAPGFRLLAILRMTPKAFSSQFLQFLPFLLIPQTKDGEDGGGVEEEEDGDVGEVGKARASLEDVSCEMELPREGKDVGKINRP